MRWPELRAYGAMLRREYQAACRGAPFWAVAGLGSLLAFWRASAPATTAALAAYQTWRTAAVGVSVVGIMLAGAAAARDRREGATELVLAKPGGSSAGLVVVRFAGLWLSLVTIAAIMLAAASVGQVTLGGTTWRPGAYGAALGLSAVPLGVAAALGYSLSSLFGTALASGVAAMYWVAVSLARPHLPAAFDLTPSQHWPLGALFGAGLVSAAAALYARRVRGVRRWGAAPGWGAGALLGAAALVALGMVRGGQDGLVRPDPVLAAMAGQAALDQRQAPGFWLPEPGGRLVAKSDFAGRPMVVAFWGPAAPESARILSVLEELASKFSEEGLVCVAVCVDWDASAAGLFRGEVREDVVLLWDQGRHYGDGGEWSDSPLAVAYGVTGVPTVFVMDEKGELRWELAGEMGLGLLESKVSDMLGGAGPGSR